MLPCAKTQKTKGSGTKKEKKKISKEKRKNKC